MRVEDGYMVVNQDANWNVTSATDLAGRVLERTFYTAYGLPTFNSETYFGDDSYDDASALFRKRGDCRDSSCIARRHRRDRPARGFTGGLPP